MEQKDEQVKDVALESIVRRILREYDESDSKSETKELESINEVVKAITNVLTNNSIAIEELMVAVIKPWIAGMMDSVSDGVHPVFTKALMDSFKKEKFMLVHNLINAGNFTEVELLANEINKVKRGLFEEATKDAEDKYNRLASSVIESEEVLITPFKALQIADSDNLHKMLENELAGEMINMLEDSTKVLIASIYGLDCANCESKDCPLYVDRVAHNLSKPDVRKKKKLKPKLKVMQKQAEA